MVIKSVLCVPALIGSTALGSTWTVDDDGADFPAADFASIQPAIDAASNGDEILVYTGLYNEVINFQGKAIIVKSAGLEPATIDANGISSSVVTFDTSETADSVLDGFRIENGTGTLVSDPIFGSVRCGGGILVRNASPTILNCKLTINACWGGSGIYNRSASPRIENCTFAENVSEGHGGGIYNLEFSDPEIINCLFEGNAANWGAGMTNTVDCDPTITGCTFSGNTTYNVGGGIFNRSRSSPAITDCSFIGNTQVNNPLGSGGGICNYGVGNGGGPCYPIITNCHFENNVVNGDGGAIANAYDTHPTVTGCTFVNNHAGRNGGGLACPGNLDPYFPSNAELHDCVFEGNTAGEYGGGFYSRASAPSVDSCVFRDNFASIGGGAAGFHDSPNATILDSSFCGSLPGDFDGLFTDLGGNTSQIECTDCFGDVTGDGVVDVDDILATIGAWGICEGCSEDVDGDGIVGVDDVLAVLSSYGNCD
ncbi:MAG: right-handed parallel beta-helix repeat-containing protein [Phycisphaerales bacterium]|nr:right-handed parallel beta-helix repeat-containing protein [Phycisphaerales bacterium]